MDQLGDFKKIPVIMIGSYKVVPASDGKSIKVGCKTVTEELLKKIDAALSVDKTKLLPDLVCVRAKGPRHLSAMLMALASDGYGNFRDHYAPDLLAGMTDKHPDWRYLMVAPNEKRVSVWTCDVFGAKAMTEIAFETLWDAESFPPLEVDSQTPVLPGKAPKSIVVEGHNVSHETVKSILTMLDMVKKPA